MKTKPEGETQCRVSDGGSEGRGSKWCRHEDRSTRGWGRDRQRRIFRSLGLMVAGLRDVSERRCCNGGHSGGGRRCVRRVSEKVSGDSTG